MALPKLTKQQQQYLIVGVVVLGALGFAYFKYFWMPISKTIRETREEIASTKAQIETAQSNAARLPKIEEELAQLNIRAIDAEQRLPKAKDVPGILVRMTALAKKNNVALVTFTPGGQVAKDFFYELNYPMSVQGSFHSIGKFLAAMALEQRIFNVVNVDYGAAAPDTSVMSVNFTLISYQYKG